MKYLALTNSTEKTIVDDDIWLRFCGYKWRLHKSRRGEYVVRNVRIKGKQKTLFLHRLVLDCPLDCDGHHKDGNKMDNRRENLEAVKISEHRSKAAKKSKDEEIPF